MYHLLIKVHFLSESKKEVLYVLTDFSVGKGATAADGHVLALFTLLAKNQSSRQTIGISTWLCFLNDFVNDIHLVQLIYDVSSPDSSYLSAKLLLTRTNDQSNC